MKLMKIIEMISTQLSRKINREVNKEESAKVLSTLLFKITNNSGQNLIAIRDYDKIKKEGPFVYTASIDTMHEEGLFPEDLYKEFQRLGLHNDVGPSYLRIKGLLTLEKPRNFFATLLAYKIIEKFEKDPPPREGYILFLPNMTGGAWIGDETRRKMEEITNNEYKIWPGTPYARSARKSIEVISKKDKITDYVEGILPPPEETSVVINFEEIRRTAETTQNTIKILKQLGYSEENDVQLIAATVFDYRHPVGIERLKRLGVDELHVVDGDTFIEASYHEGYLSSSEYTTVKEWLEDPWNFTRKILSDLERLVEIHAENSTRIRKIVE